MSSVADIVDAYIAVWNENEPAQRRRRIASLWAENGTSCYRLLDAHGHAAIAQRVTSSWEKWLADGNYVFRSRRWTSHHDAIMTEWEMVRIADGGVQANGLSFLLLVPDGKLRHDYQFNPSANDATELSERYLAALNESDPVARRRVIAEFFSPGVVVCTPGSSFRGSDAVDAAFAELRASGSGLFVTDGHSQKHHHVGRISWRRASGSGTGPAAFATHLLVFDQDGRISEDYVFPCEGAGQ